MICKWISRQFKSLDFRFNWQTIPQGTIQKSPGENIWSPPNNNDETNHLKLNISQIDELFKLPDNTRNKFSKSSSKSNWKNKTSDAMDSEDAPV